MGISNFSTLAGAVGPVLKNDAYLRYFYEDFTQPFGMSVFVNGGVAGVSAPTGTEGNVNVIKTERNSLYWTVLGTQTIVAPNFQAAGLDLVQDAGDNDGAEYNLSPFPTAGAGRAKCRFVARTDEFFIRVRASSGDVSDTDEFLVGFRLAEAFQPDYLDYNTWSYLGISASAATAAINSVTELNAGGAVTTATGSTWADNATHTLEVRINSAGVALFLVDGTFVGITQPTTQFQWDSGDVVIPSIRYRNAGNNDPLINLLELECGLLSARGLDSVIDLTAGV